MDEAAAGGFKQIIVLAMEGLGVGALPDAGHYRSRGANTLANTAVYVDGLELANLQWLGLGNVLAARGLPPADPPAASFGLMGRTSEGCDSASGLREMIGDVFEPLVEAGHEVLAFGNTMSLLSDEEEEEDPAPRYPANEVLPMVHELVGADGLIVATFGPDGDNLADHGPVNLERALKGLDKGVGLLLDSLPEDALLLVSSTGGADATLGAHDGPTREYSPLLAYSPMLQSGVPLGQRASLADIGATIAENFGLTGISNGNSFFGPLLS